jgi:hypothetical protein
MGRNVDTWEQCYLYKCNKEGPAKDEKYINQNKTLCDVALNE